MRMLLAAALLATAAVPAMADNSYAPGATASPAWVARDAGRTPLAGKGRAEHPAQALLSRSGATGGTGQAG